jgi:hypothetical protein
MTFREFWADLQLILKEIFNVHFFLKGVYVPNAVYQPGTYMSLAQSKNKRRIKKNRNLIKLGTTTITYLDVLI